jgi:hypothetical protein
VGEKGILNFVWRSQRRKAVLEGMSLTMLAEVAILDCRVAQKGEIN